MMEEVEAKMVGSETRRGEGEDGQRSRRDNRKVDGWILRR